MFESLPLLALFERADPARRTGSSLSMMRSSSLTRGLLAEDKWEQITLPIIVIAEMLGVAARDLAQFKRWSDARSQIFNMARTPEQTAESAAARQGLEARGGLSGDRIQIPRDRGFADSPLEGTGFKPSVPLF